MAKIDKLLAAAQKHIDKGNTKKAIKEYEAIVALAPDEARHHQKLADLHNREGNKAEAVETYEKVAELFENAGFETKAVAVLKKVQQLDKGECQVYYRLADLNAKLGMIGNAVSELNALAKILEEKSDLHEIIDVHERLFDLDPTNLTKAQNVVESYLAVEMIQKGGDALVKAIAVFRERSEYVKACKLSELFFPQFPDKADLKTLFSEVLVEMGETEKGITLLRNLLKDDPDNVEVLESLVRCQKQAKTYEDERLTINHLLKLDPKNLDYKKEFLRSCVDSGDKARGLEAAANWEKDFKSLDRLADFTPMKTRLDELEEDAAIGGGEITDDSGFGDLDLTGGGEDFAAVEEEPEEDLSVEVEVSLVLKKPPGEVLTKPEPPAPPSEEDITEVDEAVLEEDAPSTVHDIEPAAVEAEPENIDPEPIEEPAEEFVEPESEVIEEPEAVPEPEVLQIDEDVEEAIDHFSLDEFDIIDDLEIVEDIEPDEEVLELIELVEDDEVVDDVLDLDLSLQLSDAEVEAFERNSELEEASFYLKQGLLDEAEQICHRLLAEDAGFSNARQLLEQITAKRSEGSPAEEGGFFDLAAEIFDTELNDAFDSLGESEEEDIEGTISKFREGVDSLIGDEETEAHFDLGIAYREMGLVDDAIIEFTRAEKDPMRYIDCQLLKSECLMDEGQEVQAEKTLKLALLSDLIREDQKLSIMYQIGLLYESTDRKEEALALFTDIAGSDPFYRDVKEKIGVLKPGGDASNDDDKKSRVSYV